MLHFVSILISFFRYGISFRTTLGWIKLFTEEMLTPWLETTRGI